MDPTVALGRSHTLTSFEDKSKRSFWKPKSPFSKRKNKDESWEFIGKDPDTQSVVSEVGGRPGRHCTVRCIGVIYNNMHGVCTYLT